MNINKFWVVEALAKAFSVAGIIDARLQKLNGKVTCFMFHRVCDDRYMGVTLPIFKGVIESIRSRFEVVSMDEACDYLAMGGPKKRYAVLTFDDGYLDNYTLALPVLKQFSVPATLYVCTSFIDSGYSNWDALDTWLLQQKDSLLDLRAYGLGSHQFGGPDQRKSVLKYLHCLLKMMPHAEMKNIVAEITKGIVPSAPRTMMNWEELIEFSRTHGMTIGAHTLTHPNLTCIPKDALYEEVHLSKIKLEERLSIAVRHFAYPSGFSSKLVANEVCNAKYASACVVDDGVNSSGCNMFAIRRRSVMQDGCVGSGGGYSDNVFSFFASGCRPMIRELIRKTIRM